jgi:hypothetical protein
LRPLKLWLFIYLILSGSLFLGQDYNQFPPSGKYETDVVISVPETASLIRYSNNGDVPSTGSKKLKTRLVVSTTSHYLFRITDKPAQLDTVFSRFYLFNDTSKLPHLAIAIPKEDLWDARKGIYVKGSNAVMNDSSGKWMFANFDQHWEKVVFSTFIDTNNAVGFNQKSGLKLFGESTRRFPEKSMKIIARSEYGVGRFEYPIFPQKDMHSFKQIAIRTSGNDYNNTRFKDVLSSKLAKNIGVDYMGYRPVQLYVNGELWGVYNLREKINEHFVAENHQAHPDSVNVIMGRWVRQQGSSRKYMEMYRWFEHLDTMNSKNYEIASQYFDIRNYINFRVFQIFINNKDARGNIRYYNINGTDEKFRMLLYDTDLGWGNYRFDLMSKAVSDQTDGWYNPPWSRMYLTKLIEHPDFKNEFATQFAHIMNTALHRDTIIAAVDELEQMYINELPRTSEGRPAHLRNVYFPLEEWQKKVNSYRSFAKLRPTVIWDHINDALHLSGTFVLHIKSDSAVFSINENYDLSGSFSGKYFKNIPLHIEMKDSDSLRFVKWSDGDTSKIRIVNSSADTVSLFPLYESIQKEEGQAGANTSERTHGEVKQQIVDHLVFELQLTIAGFVFLGLGVLLLLLYLILKVGS